MIMDTSAAVAILRREPEAAAMQTAIELAPALAISAASVLELTIVTRASGSELVDRFLAALSIEVLAVDADHLRWARFALQNYGRGSGSPARLNFGDCLTYGAAIASSRPLLFKGEGFTHTDVRSALEESST